MAKIFRTLLVAAVNAIKEFLAFATDNGESQVGDTIKLNDGMATSNYDWSAYPSDTTTTGTYTQTGTVEAIKEVGGNTVYATQEPQQDDKNVSIKAGQMYYAYTNENYDLVNAEVVGTLTENNGIYSGFSTTEYGSASSSNYIHYTLNKTYSSINKLEIVFKVKTGNSFAGSGRIFNSTGQGSDIFVVGCSSSEAWLRINDSQYKGVTIYTTFNTNTNYWFKYTYNDNNDGTYKGYYSTDGVNWSEPVVQSNPLVASINVTSFDIGTRVGSVVCDWKGSIDLTKSYMKINDDTYNFCIPATSESVYTTDNPIHAGFKEWTQPTLSANGTLGGDSFAVSLTNEYSSTYAAWKAFDNNSGSCFWTSVIPADLIIYNPVPLNVTALHWEVYDYNRRPTDWEWYGSNDNETYTLISSGTNNSDNFTLNFTPSVAYKYHKFKVLSAYNQLNAKQITLTAKEKEQTTPSTLYNSNFQPLDPQPEFTVNEVGLINATEYGTLTNNNGVYSGFNSSNFIYLNTTTPQTSMDFIIKCNPSTGYGDLLRTQPDGRGILLRCTSSSASCYLSSSGSGWNVLSGFSTGLTFTANTDTYVRITWNSSNGVYTFWQSSDGQNWTERNSSSSGLAAPYWNSGNQTIGACSSYSEHWYGSVDMKETKLIIDGNTINFYNTLNGIIINSDNYIKTSDNDLIQPIAATIETVDNTTINSVSIILDQTATIETSANITTSNNNNVITDGSYHLFNLTVPTSMTAVIESNGISYQTNEMPLLLKNGVGVGLLLKNGNNVYYRNTWIINRDYDLHFQEIRFATNVQDPTITLKINNVLTSAPYYTYAGDKIEYIISKEGYCDYTGTLITSYTSKDGKITTINAELVVSNGTVDVSNYKYTLNNQGNMILTKYKGDTDAVVPNI